MNYEQKAKTLCEWCRGGAVNCPYCAKINAALREAAAEAFEESSDILASHGEQPLTPNSIRLRWSNKMNERAAALRKYNSVK